MATYYQTGRSYRLSEKPSIRYPIKDPMNDDHSKDYREIDRKIQKSLFYREILREKKIYPILICICRGEY